MNRPRDVLILGYGYTAAHAAPVLLQSSTKLRASTRNPATAEAMRAVGVEPILADPSTEEGRAALNDALAQSEAVIATAAPTQTGDPFFHALDPGALAETRTIYLSTTGVYGDRQGGWAFEWEPPTPGQERSIRRAEAEQLWLSVGAVCLRLGGIYGPGRSALDRVRAGTAIAYDKPGQVFSRIHVEDIASAIADALARLEVTGPINLVDDMPSPPADPIIYAAELLGAPRPERRAVAVKEMSAMQASFYSENKRVSNALAKTALGWRPRYASWKTGLAAILASGG